MAALEDGLIDRLSANGDRLIRRHDFTGRMLNANSSTQPTTLPATTNPIATDRTETAIGSSIRQAIAAYQGQPIAGILLVTDGQSNTGEPPVKAG